MRYRHRILVTGSRDWTDFTVVHYAMTTAEYYFEGEGAMSCDFSLVSGACPSGADLIAEGTAEKLGWEIERFPAQWQDGKGAGFARNRQMVATGPDLALAFQRNASRGTAHTIELCRKAGIPVWIWSQNDRADSGSASSVGGERTPVLRAAGWD